MEFRRELFWLAADTVRSQVRQNTWDAFRLTAIEELSVASAARQLGMKDGAVLVLDVESSLACALSSPSLKRLRIVNLSQPLPSESMMIDNNHLSDSQLRALLFEPEEGLDSTDISLHIESCQTCQIRLTELADETSIETEACQMLSGYSEASRNVESRSSMSASTGSGTELSFDRVVLEPPTHPEMLGRIERYEVERCIGSGGMGVVFKAIDTELNRPVAVKVLAPHLARNGAARQRFSRESRAAAAVVHEHVVAIHNVDSSVEHPYLVMQYVAGESLQARVDREGPLGVEQILRIGIQAALGLAAAHQQGIVHRDIKPANILLEDGVERLLITDFGLARTVDDASLTHTGVVAGTPNYMSPEQAKGDETDHRTDLFSLGSVLYFVATGIHRFELNERWACCIESATNDIDQHGKSIPRCSMSYPWPSIDCSKSVPRGATPMQLP